MLKEHRTQVNHLIKRKTKNNSDKPAAKQLRLDDIIRNITPIIARSENQEVEEAQTEETEVNEEEVCEEDDEEARCCLCKFIDIILICPM